MFFRLAVKGTWRIPYLSPILCQWKWETRGVTREHVRSRVTNHVIGHFNHSVWRRREGEEMYDVLSSHIGYRSLIIEYVISALPPPSLWEKCVWAVSSDFTVWWVTLEEWISPPPPALGFLASLVSSWRIPYLSPILCQWKWETRGVTREHASSMYEL